MKQWTPEQQKRFRALCHELVDLTNSNDELYLLLAFVRMFYQVKREAEAKRRERDRLEAKFNGDDTDTNQIHIVK